MLDDFEFYWRFALRRPFPKEPPPPPKPIPWEKMTAVQQIMAEEDARIFAILDDIAENGFDPTNAALVTPPPEYPSRYERI